MAQIELREGVEYNNWRDYWDEWCWREDQWEDDWIWDYDGWRHSGWWNDETDKE